MQHPCSCKFRVRLSHDLYPSSFRDLSRTAFFFLVFLLLALLALVLRVLRHRSVPPPVQGILTQDQTFKLAGAYRMSELNYCDKARAHKQRTLFVALLFFCFCPFLLFLCLASVQASVLLYSHLILH